MYLCPLSYCLYEHDTPQKVTYFWTDSQEVRADFVEVRPNGDLKMRKCCGRAGCTCGNFKKHAHSGRQEVRGQYGKRNTDTYPQKLCDAFSVTMRKEMYDRRCINCDDDPDYRIGNDGYYSRCCARHDPEYEGGSRPLDFWRPCDDPQRQHDRTLEKCCGCPRVFHHSCRPVGRCEKPAFDDENARVFLCELCAPVGWQLLKDIESQQYTDLPADVE